MAEIQILKKQFLDHELSLLTMRASLSTRDEDWPVYSKSTTITDRSKPRDELRNLLFSLEQKYASPVSENDHLKCIKDVSERLSDKLKPYLHQGRFRIGITQKLVNLHLKYLWTANLCPEPPHCPIDGIIRDRAALDFHWTKNDSLEDYKKAIASLRKKAGNQSLACWELKTFKRPGDKRK